MAAIPPSPRWRSGAASPTPSPRSTRPSRPNGRSCRSSRWGVTWPPGRMPSWAPWGTWRPAPAAGAGLVRLLRLRAAERGGVGAAGRRPARARGGGVGAGLHRRVRHAGRARRGLLHWDPDPHRLGAGRRRGGARGGSHRLRRRLRRDRGGLPRRRPRARGGAAIGDADGDAKRVAPWGQRGARSPPREAHPGMTRLVEVPVQFDDRSFDQFVSGFAAAGKDGERLLFDAHAAEWASPYGLVGLLAAGEAARRARGGEAPLPGAAPARAVRALARGRVLRGDAPVFEGPRRA